jgi:oligosaccharyltransferase complex subunit alpha (ribophorin I)
VKYSTSLPLVDEYTTVHNTFMDTQGRPTIVLTSVNGVEEWRDRGALIVTYDYSWIAGLRKPLTIAVSIFGVFFAAWVIGTLDFRIGKKKIS